MPLTAEQAALLAEMNTSSYIAVDDMLVPLYNVNIWSDKPLYTAGDVSVLFKGWTPQDVRECGVVVKLEQDTVFNEWCRVFWDRVDNLTGFYWLRVTPELKMCCMHEAGELRLLHVAVVS